jgi:hypothetical protein
MLIAFYSRKVNFARLSPEISKLSLVLAMGREEQRRCVEKGPGSKEEGRWHREPGGVLLVFFVLLL